MWEFWWANRYWGKFSPSILVSPVNSHSIDCSTSIIIIIIIMSFGDGTIGQLVAEVPSGLSPIPPQESKKSLQIYFLLSS
jgi:hypothetical protein